MRLAAGFPAALMLFMAAATVAPAQSAQVAGTEPVTQPVPTRRQSVPNVLFIVVDDLRPSLGCFGATQIKSPNIDRLAATGVAFTRAYCQQAVCGPSRASFLTGLRPDSTGVTDNEGAFRKQTPEVVTLPQHFKQNGYRVEGMGKIFHEVRGYTQFGDPRSWSVPCQFPKAPSLLWLDPINAGRVAKKQAALRAKGAKDWETYAGARGPAYESPDVPDAAYHDGELADMAVAALKRLKTGDTPFFLAVGFLRPHLPFCAPKMYWDLYDPAEIATSPVKNWPKDSPPLAHISWGELRSYHGIPGSGPVSHEQAIHLIHGYYASVSYLDAQVGRVLDELERLGLADKTVVILVGDHGWKLSEYSAWSKCTSYEIDARVPLIIRARTRQTAAGRPRDGLVELVDIYPTLAELCGLPVPAHCEGASCVPTLKDPAARIKTAAFSQWPSGECMGYSIRTDRWRYTEWIHCKTHQVVARELYDHQAAALDLVNLAKDPAHAATVRELSAKLAGGKGWKP